MFGVNVCANPPRAKAPWPALAMRLDQPSDLVIDRACFGFRGQPAST
jgi:hypothetical protein